MTIQRLLIAATVVAMIMFVNQQAVSATPNNDVTLETPMVELSAPSVPYNESLAKMLALFSAAAYSPQPDKCPKVWPSTFKLLNTFSAPFQGQTIFGYIGVDQSNKQILVAYRGSVSVTQLLQELTLSAPTDWPGKNGVQVLQYFLQASQTLSNQTRSAVANLVQLFPGYAVVITGHSLGGSLAILAAYDLIDQGIVQRPLVYTFGQPRTGNYRFSQEIMAKIPDMYRLTHYRDIVAHLPPCNTTFDITKLTNVCTAGDPTKGWWNYHHGTEVWYPQELMPSAFSASVGQYKVCPGSPLGEDYQCSDSLILKSSIDNHKVYFNVSLGNYCPDSVMSLPPFLGGDGPADIPAELQAKLEMLLK